MFELHDADFASGLFEQFAEQQRSGLCQLCPFRELISRPLVDSPFHRSPSIQRHRRTLRCRRGYLIRDLCTSMCPTRTKTKTKEKSVHHSPDIVSSISRTYTSLESDRLQPSEIQHAQRLPLGAFALALRLDGSPQRLLRGGLFELGRALLLAEAAAHDQVGAATCTLCRFVRVAGCDADEFGVDLVAGGAFEREHEGVVRVGGEEGGDGEELCFELKGEFLQEGVRKK